MAPRRDRGGRLPDPPRPPSGRSERRRRDGSRDGRGRIGGDVMTITSMGAATAAPDHGRQRPVGYAPRAPRGATLETLRQIRAVLDARADYWPITPRQILYRLVGA